MTLKKIGVTRDLSTKYVINSDYVLGLIESDGSISINLRDKYFRISVTISSLTNSNTLNLIKSWLLDKGISCCIDVYLIAVHVPLRERIAGTSYSRSNLTISGNIQVEKFFNILKKEVTSDFLFCGVKYRDYLLACAFFKVRHGLNNAAELLAIKKSMHKSNYLEVDSSSQQILPYKVLEARLGLSGVILSSTFKLLKEVDREYEIHRLNIKRAISENRLYVARSFVAGLIDGDGSFYITVSWKDANKSYSKRHIHWEGCFTLSTDRHSELIFDLLKFVFKLPPTLQVKALKTPSTKNTTGAVGSYQIWVRNQEQMRFLLGYLRGYLCGNYRILQYNSVCKLFDMRVAGLLENKTSNIEPMKVLLREIYAISEISKKGSLRNPPTVKEALSKTDEWLI